MSIIYIFPLDHFSAFGRQMPSTLTNHYTLAVSRALANSYMSDLICKIPLLARATIGYLVYNVGPGIQNTNIINFSRTICCNT